jgi:asparagine synthase (glutamine-hydrolysing)
VLIREGKHTIDKFWDFDPAKKIRYRSDAEYEEHFRAVFGEAVRRRLRSDNPILAELSGGMDSSSIVCMADTITARGVAETPRLDTVSYYDDSEPNWNERPYFEKVEQKRGRTGCHIDAVPQQSLTFGRPSDRFAATPGSGTFLNEAHEQFTTCITSQGNRVVLSGIGGDEATGGVPTPIPEFENLIARAQFKLLAHQLKVWALNKRKPWFHLFFEAARGFLPPALLRAPKHRRPAVWLDPVFAQRHWIALTGYESRVRLLGPLPSFLENIYALNALRRQLACDAQPSEPCYEKRYPYLDRSLLEFLYQVPREQLVRPGQRRSLMRRALVGILPEELLNRKRKAFVARGPRAAISQEWITLMEATQDMVSASLGILDQNVFSTSWKRARQGQEVQVIALMRTLFVESWLRGLRNKGILASSPQNPGEPLKSLAINNRSLS